MTIITSGIWPISPSVTTGTDLATHLNELVQAINSSQASASRPPMIAKGGVWAKTAGATDISIMFYDGAVDHEIGSVIGGVAKFGGATFNSGATATKPAAPAKGDMFLDTTLNQLEIYDGTAWKNPLSSISQNATGDVVVDPTKKLVVQGGDVVPQPSYNHFINGGMIVSQRGVVNFTTSANLYGGADRWLTSLTGTTATAALRQSAFPSQSGYCHHLSALNLSANGVATITQRIESLNAKNLNGKTVTISCKVQQDTGAALDGKISIAKANTVDNFNAGTTVIVSSPIKSIPSGAPTEIVFTHTFGANDCDNGFQASFLFTSAPAITNKNIMFFDAKLEEGKIKTPIDYREYGYERALCQRYFQKSYNQDVTAGTVTSAGAPTLRLMNAAGFSGFIQFSTPLKVTMRIPPTMKYYSPTTGAVGQCRLATSNRDTTITDGGEHGDSSIAPYTNTTVVAYDSISYHYTADAEL